MCELFGMSARYPTNVNHSLALLQPRGGQLAPHADGWGVAFFEGPDARVFKEPLAAAESRHLDFIARSDHQSPMVLAHIRKANPSHFGCTTANTHPFSRELAGRTWVFAHNGKIPQVREHPKFALSRFHPVGDTDSEHAFCYLLDQLAGVATREPLTAPVLGDKLAAPVAELSELGEFNFLMSDGHHLVAYANTKLHSLSRRCRERECDQLVTLVATAPLTDEPWTPFSAGQFRIYSAGEDAQ